MPACASAFSSSSSSSFALVSQVFEFQASTTMPRKTQYFSLLILHYFFPPRGSHFKIFSFHFLTKYTNVSMKMPLSVYLCVNVYRYVIFFDNTVSWAF